MSLKIHMLHDVGFRVKGDPIESQHHALCKAYQTAHINPKTTTWDKTKVTCRHCRKRIVGVAKCSDLTWETWLDANTPNRTGGPREQVP